MKPVIGITTNFREEGYKVIGAVYNYVEAIVKAGGVPFLIPIINSPDDLEQYLDMLDGILFTGGEDILPLLFGEEPLKQVKYVSIERDEQELVLFKKAYERKIPILGICRGQQLMNIALGGTLYQDMDSQIPGVGGHSQDRYPEPELYHSINIEKDSKLFEAMGVEKINVNSFHHQCVKTLGKGLKVTALSKEGIIEAIETTDDQFAVTVQFHPECLVSRYKEWLKLFVRFINECGNC